MCVNGGILDSSIWKNCEINKFFHILEIDLRSKLISCMNMWWTTKNTWWTIWTTFKHVKNIQSYLNNPLAWFNLNLKFYEHIKKKKKRLGKGIIPACKIYTVEEEVFDGGPKGEVEEKN